MHPLKCTLRHRRLPHMFLLNLNMYGTVCSSDFQGRANADLICKLLDAKQLFEVQQQSGLDHPAQSQHEPHNDGDLAASDGGGDLAASEGDGDSIPGGPKAAQFTAGVESTPGFQPASHTHGRKKNRPPQERYHELLAICRKIADAG